MTDLCVGSVMASAALVSHAAVPASPTVISVNSAYSQYPVYMGDDLGITIIGETAKFRMWSPSAQAVKLKIYANARGGVPETVVEMEKSENGTWKTAITPVPYGKYYTFQVKDNGKWLSLIHI